MKKKIAVFHNSTGVIEKMKYLFDGEGLQMQKISGLDELVHLIRNDHIYLILADLKLNETGIGDEIETIQCIRKYTAIPIIVVSNQMAETAKIMSLNVGADDYITMQDNPLVFLARVKAHIRRYIELMDFCANIECIYRVGELELNDYKHTVTVKGREVKMTPIEYKILRLLIQNQGKVVSVKQIYESIWQMNAIDAENIVTVHIRHIREKIENDPGDPYYLKLVRGFGYKVG